MAAICTGHSLTHVQLYGRQARGQHGGVILQLRANDYLRLRRARGAAIEVLAGRVWITEDGRGADRFLGPGRRYQVWGDGLVLVSAEAALSELSVRPG